MEHNSIADRIAIIRENNKLNSRQMAISLDIDPSQYLKIEKGKLNLPVEKAKVLCSTYGIDINWLLTGEGEMLLSTSEKAYNAARDTNKYDPQPTNLTEFLLMDKLNSIHRELETLKRQMNELNKKKPPEDVED